MNKCKVIGCNCDSYSKGLCQKHYMKQRRGSLSEPTIDSLLEELKKYEGLIHHFTSTVTHQKSKELFTLLESIIKY